MAHAEKKPIEQKHISLLWAEPECAHEIAQLHKQLIYPPWDENAIRDLLAHPCSSALIAKVRTNPSSPPDAVGFVMGQIAADEVEILSIGIAKPFQRQGLARRLVEGLIRASARAEASQMFLEVAKNNAPALALYSQLGFNETGRRTGYYKTTDGQAVDALILSRQL